GGARVGPPALPADPDDGLRLHPGRGAAHARERGGRRGPERDGHRGVLGNARGHRPRPVPDPGQLRFRRAPWTQEARSRIGIAAATCAVPRGSALMSRRLMAVSLALFATGCALGPNYKRPEVPTPPAWREIPVAEAQSLANTAWWDLFDDPQ